MVVFSMIFPIVSEQIERDTNGMLQCHPHPHEHVDTSRPSSHCAFFMGLQRKEGVRGQEGQQFDIRGTVDEFRQEVNMYMFWKPGMDIYVSHVRRKQLPAFVFPDGYKRSRLSRHISPQSKKISEEAAGCQPSSAEKKRENDSEAVDVKPIKQQKQESISPQRSVSVSPESNRSGAVRLDCLRTGDANCTSEIRSSGGLLEDEKYIIGNNVEMVQNAMQEPISRNLSPEAKEISKDAAGCQPSSAEKKRKNDLEALDVKPTKQQKRVSINPQQPASVSPESNRSGVVGLECLRTGESKCSSEVRSRGELLESEKHIIGKNVEMVQNSMQEPISLKEQAFICVSNLSGPENEVRPVDMVGALPFSEFEETHEIERNGDGVGNLVLVEMANVETTPTGRLLNWTDGAVDVDQDLVRPCNQTTVMENTEPTFKPASNVKNLNCEVSFSI